MSIDGHIEAWEIELKLKTSTWYKTPQDKDFESKTLYTFIKTHMSSLGAMIYFSLLITKYDQLVRQYETILVNYINLTMNKAKALGTIAPTQLESNTIAAKTMCAKDPTSKIKLLVSQRAQLTAEAKILHSWITETLETFVVV